MSDAFIMPLSYIMDGTRIYTKSRRKVDHATKTIGFAGAGDIVYRSLLTGYRMVRCYKTSDYCFISQGVYYIKRF